MTNQDAPRYIVKIRQSGQKTAEYVDVTDRVESLRHDDSDTKADVITLTLDNFDLANFDNPLWAHGNFIQYAYGYESEVTVMREAIIKKITGGVKMKVTAHGKAVILDRAKFRLVYENLTRSEVVEVIAKRNGFTSKRTFADRTTERFETISQPNLTDAQMLRKLAHQEGFEFWVDTDGLHWHVRKVGQPPIREIIYYTGQPGDVLDFSVENDITRKPARVRGSSRDPKTKKTITAVADDETESDRELMQEGKPTRTLRLDFDGETGAITESYEDAHEDDVISNAQTEGELKTEVKKKFKKASLRAVKMSLSMIGDPKLVAKAVVRLTGFGTRLSGLYYIKGISSQLGGDGFKQSLKLITDGYQRKSKKKPKKGATHAELVAQLLEVEQAALAINDQRLFDLAREFTQGAGKIISANPSSTQYERLAVGSRRFSAVVQQSSRTATGAAKTANSNMIAQVAKFATLASNLANSSDPVNHGNLNTNEVADDRSLTPRIDIDGETGQTTSTFVRLGGRQDK